MMKSLRHLVLTSIVLAGAAVASPVGARGVDDFEQQFDRTFGAGLVHPQAAPVVLSQRAAMPAGFEARLANPANAPAGRNGGAAVDLSTGHGISVMGDQPFPLASTGKVAIVATFLDGVDQGRFSLSDRYPLMVPVPSRKFSTEKAPVRAGAMLSAEQLIELAITRSDNHATDALLAAIGGPQAVTRWLRKSGITGIRLDRDIATMVRDDGEIDPARAIDLRDSTTPQAMACLLYTSRCV